MEFPRWEYHAEQGARLFKTPSELEEAGAGWVDSPALLTPLAMAAAIPEEDSEPVKRGPGRPRKVS